MNKFCEARELTYEEYLEHVSNVVKEVIGRHDKFGKAVHEVAIDITKTVAMAIKEASKEANLN